MVKDAEANAAEDAKRKQEIEIRYHFFFNDTATTEIYTLSLHDALPISRKAGPPRDGANSGLGLEVARYSGCGKHQEGTIGLGVAARGKRNQGDLPDELATLPRAELEPWDGKILQRAIAQLRRSAHFWAVRFPGTGGRGGVPAQRDSLRC